MSRDGLQPVGRITGAHGVSGEVRVLPYEGFSDFEGQVFSLVFPEGAVKRSAPARLKVGSVRRHNDGYLITFDGVSDRDAARALSGIELALPAEELPPLEADEHYFYDLEGMDVETVEGEVVGTVTGLISSGGNDVLVVTGPGGEVLIPTAGDFIEEVDDEARLIRVRLIEGMLPGT